MHLAEKTVLRETGQPTQVKRRYDQACTPFDRLCATAALFPPHREQLEALRDQTNLRQLRQEIYALIEAIFALPGAVPGVTENVYQTLTTHSSPEKGASYPFNFSFNRTTILA